MDKPLVDFIQALRHHGLPISPAETLDALNAVTAIGVEDRSRLKCSLSLTLAKTLEHRGRLEQLFDEFFTLPSGAKTYNIANREELITASDLQQPNVTGDVIQSELGQQLLMANQVILQRNMIAAAADAGATEMKIFLQISRVTTRILMAMGDRELQRELHRLQSEEKHLELVAQIQSRRQILISQIKNYVEQQYLLFSSKTGEKLSEGTLHKIKITHVDHVQQQQLAKLVNKIAKKLASMHSRRRKVYKRGLLDVRKTIASNAAFDGFLFHTHWKSTRIERPKVMILCDVSGSVAAVARFLLLFVYSLQDVLPKVRSFVFSNQLGEVTNCFRDYRFDDAINLVMDEWANRSTDYGRSLQDFSELAMKQIDHKTQVIMLGDARNNHDDGRTEIWQQVYTRAQRVLWLNPEDRSKWNTGDSIINQYAPYCSLLEPCSSLRDMERILGRLLKNAN